MKYWIISLNIDADPHTVGETLKSNGFSDVRIMATIRMISGAAEEQNVEKCRKLDGIINIHEDGIVYAPQA